MTAPFPESRRWTRVTLGIALSSMVFWIWLMWYVHSLGKSGASVYVFLPFLLLTGLNAFNAYRKLRRMPKASAPAALTSHA